jgi:hypothetical protein
VPSHNNCLIDHDQVLNEDLKLALFLDRPRGVPFPASHHDADESVAPEDILGLGMHIPRWWGMPA